MAQRRGISNVVATIILIAVAIALAVAVAIWVFGLFRSNAHAGTLNVVSEDLYLTTSGGNYLVLYIVNPVGSSQTILSVTLSGNTCYYLESSSTSPPPSSLTATATTPSSVTITGGETTYLVYYCPGSYMAGVSYSGTIYLSTGANIPFTVTAQSVS